MPKGELAGRVLLVDDLADSGVTLRAVVDRLRGMPSITELRSAVIWIKGVSSYMPDYFVETAADEPLDPSAVRGVRRPAARRLWRRNSRSDAGALRTTGQSKRPQPRLLRPLSILVPRKRTRTSTMLPAST